MAFIVNKFVRYLTKRHDRRNARHSYEPGLNGPADLTPCEQIPSVMLAFHLLETVEDDQKLLRLMKKVFQKNPNVKNQYGMAGETLLYAACKRGAFELVQFCADNGVNCMIVTPLGSAYHGALNGLLADIMTWTEFEKMVRYLHTQGCDLDAVNNGQMSPFLFAVDQCHLPAVRLFVTLGCEVNLQCRLAYHALHLACLKNQPEVVKCLLAINSVQRNPVSEQGWSPLFMAVNEWIQMFYKRTNAESSHQQVRVKGHLQVMVMVEALLLAGANPLALSAKQSFNLIKTLLQIRKEETNKGRWCSICSRPVRDQNGSHDCHHPYIGCPCKLTSLSSPQADTEECADGPISSPGRNSQYGTTAVPCTSQILAVVLLYGSHHHQYHGDQPSDYHLQLNQCQGISMDMSDPYVDSLLRHFTQTQQHNRPLPLKALSRSVIRVEVGENLERLDELPVPGIIKDYLAMKVLI